jgi:hypothetical protein
MRARHLIANAARIYIAIAIETSQRRERRRGDPGDRAREASSLDRRAAERQRYNYDPGEAGLRGGGTDLGEQASFVLESAAGHRDSRPSPLATPGSNRLSAIRPRAR